MVVNGAIGLQVGQSRIRLETGDYYLLPEGVQHGGLDQALFDAAFFHFVLPGTTAQPAWPEAELEMHGKLPEEINYLDLYRFIERQYRRGTVTAEGLGIQLYAIMEQIAATQHHRRLAANASSHYLAAAILDLLQSHYAEELTAREISRQLGYSYTHLERMFTREFGMSIHQRLLRIRIDAAAHGLQMGKSIKEVAADSAKLDPSSVQQ
jgi:AraC-like DNA-binding protein